MQLSNLAAILAIALPLATATTYPITASSLECRSSPSTSGSVKQSYKEGDEVSISCQTTGTTVSGNNIWDKTGDGCYVADYYVKTGSSSMVTGPCDGGSGGGSSTNGQISRDEIIKRGKYWTDKHVPYSMDATYPDLDGTKYRTDCSGFVSMAFHSTAPGASTVTLPDIGKEISSADLKPGDFVGTLGAGTGGAGGHVVLFYEWSDSSHKSYKTLECRGTAYGCVEYEREVGWTDNGNTAKPYRYIHVSD